MTNITRGAALVALSLTLQACMFQPLDGSTINSKMTPVSFSGYYNQPDASVSIDVFDHSSGQFVSVATTRTDGADEGQTYDGIEWFGWEHSVAVPSWGWRAGKTGHFARVKSRVGGMSLYSFQAGWEKCYNENEDTGDFLANCPSPNSPEAYVFTSDYPAGVDLYFVDIWPTENGTIAGQVHNRGREGVVSRVTCFSNGQVITRTIDQKILPGQSIIVGASLPVYTGLRVTCTVEGENPDGTEEVLVCSGTPEMCGDNTRSEYIW